MPEKQEEEKENGKKKAGFFMPVFVVVLSVLVIGGVIVYLNYANFAKMAIEKMATRTLGVNVTLGDLAVDLKNMKVDVTDLRIANPQGYSKPYAATVEAIEIDLSQFEQTLVTFDTISVSGTAINLEVKENGTNLSAIRNNMNRKASASDVQQAPAAENDGGAAQKEPVRVIIEQLLIDNAVLNPSSTLTGGDMASVILPDIVLRGIGRKENGVLASEAMAQILDYVTKVAVDAAARAGFLQGMNMESLKALQSSLGLSSGFVDRAKEDIKELGDGLKSLLGR